MSPEAVWAEFNSQRQDLVRVAMEKYSDLGVQKMISQ